MPTTITYPLPGEPVRLASGDLGRINGVETVDAGVVWANVAVDDGPAVLAVPVAWDATLGEWSELTGPLVP